MDINSNPEDEEYVKITTSLDETDLKKITTLIPKEDQELEISQEIKKDNQLLSSPFTEAKENNSNYPNDNIVEHTKETLNNLFSTHKTSFSEGVNKNNLNENFEFTNEKDNSLILNTAPNNLIKNDYDNYKYIAISHFNKKNNELNEIEKNDKNEENNNEKKIDTNLDEIKNLNQKIIRDKEIITNINKNFSFGNKDNSTDRIYDPNENNTINAETISHKSLHRKCRSRPNIKKINTNDFYFNYKNEEFFNNLNSKNPSHERKIIIDNINNNVKNNIDNDIKKNLYSNPNINTNLNTNDNSNINTNINAYINTNISNDMDNDFKNNMNTNINIDNINKNSYTNINNINKNSYTNINYKQENIFQEKKLENIENLNIDDEKNINSNAEYFNSKKFINDDNIKMNDSNNNINNNGEETDLQNNNNKFPSKISSINSYSSSVLDSLSIKRADEEEKNMRIQIEDEERKLRELEKEKERLIEEEKERRKVILNAIAKQKQNKKKAKSLIQKNKIEDEKKLRNIYFQQEKNKTEIQQLLSNRQRDEEKLILMEKKENQYNNNFYDSSLNENGNNNYYKKISQKNRLSNHKNQEVFRNTETNFTHNYPQNINKNNYFKNTNEDKKYNLTSYFQYKHSPNQNSKYKSCYNLSGDGLSSMIDDTNKLSHINTESSASSIPLTPNMLYRNYRSCDKRNDNIIPNNNSFSHTRLLQRNILLPEEEIRIQQYDKGKKRDNLNGNNSNYLNTLNYDNEKKNYNNNFTKISRMSSKIAEFHRKNIENLKKTMKVNLFNTKNVFENIDKNYLNYTEKQNIVYKKNLYNGNNFDPNYANSRFHNNSTTKINPQKGRLYENFQDVISQSNKYIDTNRNINNNIDKNYQYRNYDNSNINTKSSTYLNKICSPVIVGENCYNNSNSLKMNLNQNYIPWYNYDSNIATCENCNNERNMYHAKNKYETKININGKHSQGNDVLKLCPYCKELYRKSRADFE